MRHLLITQALAICSLLISAARSDASIETGTSAAGSIARDTSTGLEWLDLSVSTNMSFDDVSDEFGGGGQFAGFRHASESEVSTFFANLGLVPGGSISGVATGATAIAYVGKSGGVNRTSGIFDDGGSSSSVGVASILLSFFPPTSRTTISTGQVAGTNFAPQQVGHWLVRDPGEQLHSPEPAGLVVWGGLALIGAAFVAKRKRSRSRVAST